ncbi:hypothetical protein V8E53_001087, partial [Lactarius tabidus]
MRDSDCVVRHAIYHDGNVLVHFYISSDLSPSLFTGWITSRTSSPAAFGKNVFEAWKEYNQFQTMILRWFEIAPQGLSESQSMSSNWMTAKRCALSLCSLCPFRTDRSNRFSSPEVPINCHLGRKYPRSPLRVLSNGPLMTPGGRAIACCVLWQTFRFYVRRDHRAGSTGVGPERFRTRTQLQNVVLNMATVCSSDWSATRRRGGMHAKNKPGRQYSEAFVLILVLAQCARPARSPLGRYSSVGHIQVSVMRSY